MMKVSTRSSENPGDTVIAKEGESGMILIVLFAAILPLIVLVGSASSSMTSKNKELVHDIRKEKAMLAADAGIDEALWRAANGTLVSGESFNVEVSPGQTFTVDPVFLGGDGEDNDGDGQIDESSENVFRLIITGSYSNARTKLAGYLGPLPALPLIEAAVTVTNPNMEIELEDTPLISGVDVNMDGSPGLGPDVPGMSIQPPGVATDMVGGLGLNPGEYGFVQGNSPTPSLGVTSSVINMAELHLAIQNTANMVLTNEEYGNVNWGDGPAGDFNIIYRDGDLELEQGGQGAGILFVTGELEMEDGWRWDGLIVCLGDEFELEGEGSTADVYGGVILGAGVEEFEMEDISSVHYSKEVLQQIGLLIPGSEYVSFNGWQEISIYYGDEVVYVDPVVGGGSTVDPTTNFGTGAVIGASCTIKENSTFGDYATIGDGTTVKENGTFGNNLSVGAGSVVKENCNFGNSVQVGDGSTVKENTTVGNNVTIGDGVMVGEGSTIGDGATVTDGATVPPGTVIPPGATY